MLFFGFFSAATAAATLETKFIGRAKVCTVLQREASVH